jgi:hypothetical protein
MRRRESVVTFWTFVLALLCAPVILLAQEEPVAAPNFVEVGVNAIAALTPVLSVAVLWVLKLAWSKVPASLVLFAAPVVGMLIEFGLSYLAGHPPTNVLVGALAGSLGVYLREFASTLVSKGFGGSVTITKAML